MGIKRSDMNADEFGKYLCRQYDAAVEAGHPAHKDVNLWRAIARGESVESAATYPTQSGTASDAAMRRSWSKASAPVRAALDSAFVAGRSASDAVAVAEGALRHAGYSPTDRLFTELRAYTSAATTPRGAADAMRSQIPGYDRLR